MQATMTIVRAGAAGLLGAVLLACAAFLLFPGSWVSEFFLAPGLLLGAAIASLVPSGALYAVVPDGGGPAYVLLAAFCTLVFWASVIGFTFSCYIRRARS